MLAYLNIPLFYKKKPILTRVEFCDKVVVIVFTPHCGVDKIKEREN